MDKENLVWTCLDSEPGPELPLFRVRYDTLQHPHSKAEFKRIVLETSDWVNVIALTQDLRLIMVEQFRFGVSQLTLEPAAGMVDPGERSLDAAKRELLEETGYGGGTWRSLGSVQANPAIHNNECHHWLAEDVELLQEPQPEAGEAIKVHLVTLDDVKAAINSGLLKHPLALSALSRVFPLWEHPFEPGTASE